MHPERMHTMSNSLNIQLTTELRRYVDERASDHDVYATPSEFVRDLIRKDRAQRIAGGVIQGLREIGQGKSVKKTAMDIFNEE
jgi:antitoxin ParD1/3/4